MGLLISPSTMTSSKIPFLKKRYTKLYGSVENAKQEMKKYEDVYLYGKEIGLAMRYAHGYYLAVIAFYIWGIYYVVAHYRHGLWDFFNNNMIICLGVLLVLSLVTKYYVSDRKGIYKKRFKELDKIEGRKRLIYKILTLLFVFGSIAFWFWSLDFANR
jgi:hypothetical protein